MKNINQLISVITMNNIVYKIVSIYNTILLSYNVSFFQKSQYVKGANCDPLYTPMGEP